MKCEGEMRPLLEHPSLLASHIIEVLIAHSRQARIFASDDAKLMSASAVLFPLGMFAAGHRSLPEPCLILNKRSAHVPQPGDLCCPGGSVTPRLDVFLAKLLSLPLSGLARWPHWATWRERRPMEARALAVLFATSLRESFEEMRLNPLTVKFLGPLPPQRLVMFQRVIYPMVAWIPRQKRFHPNWEVEKIVFIPLRDLINPAHYACCRFHLGNDQGAETGRPANEHPCFRHADSSASELLWGATYRITTVFLKHVFRFAPPDITLCPVVNESLREDYFGGPRPKGLRTP
ncbi:MAG: CoA pyrophosphatase [Desulfobacterales bacterium]|nr:MAG: CoA pyrophosphatase [Desulfobacterales bacterium]